MLPGLDMDDEVFVLSNMVVDVHDFPGGRFLGFNGTVEWALDSVQQERALWLPNESQAATAWSGPSSVSRATSPPTRAGSCMRLARIVGAQPCGIGPCGGD